MNCKGKEAMTLSANKHTVKYVVGLVSVRGGKVILAWLASRGSAKKQTPRSLSHW